MFVQEAEAELGLCITLLGGLTKPLECFGVILGNDLAEVVPEAEVVLGPCVTLLSGL